MIDAELMALEEINREGGILGRKVECVIADGRSDFKVFAQEARALIETEKVCVIFGCLTGLCRRSVKTVVEPANHLLVFPSSYEGMDLPSSVVCTGPVPNQQVIPAVYWCLETLKARKFFSGRLLGGHLVDRVQRNHQRSAQGDGCLMRWRKIRTA